MAYTKQTWENDAAGGTPTSAARFNYMEDGIEAAANTNPVPSGSTTGQTLRWNGTDWIADWPTVVAMIWDGVDNYNPTYYRDAPTKRIWSGPTDPDSCTGCEPSDYDEWEDTS